MFIEAIIWITMTTMFVVILIQKKTIEQCKNEFKEVCKVKDGNYEDLASAKRKLESENLSLLSETIELHNKLHVLKPFEDVIKDQRMKPAISRFCELCDYRVMSGDNVIGCCKGLVCDDFERKGRVESNV